MKKSINLEQCIKNWKGGNWKLSPTMFDINQRDEYGKTLLHYAVSYETDPKDFRKQEDIVNHLLKNGADPTILSYAKKRRVIALLKETLRQYY